MKNWPVGGIVVHPGRRPSRDATEEAVTFVDVPSTLTSDVIQALTEHLVDFSIKWSWVRREGSMDRTVHKDRFLFPSADCGDVQTLIDEVVRRWRHQGSGG